MKKGILIILVFVVILVLVGFRVYFWLSNENTNFIANSETKNEFIITSNLGSFQYNGFNELAREDGGKYYKASYNGGSGWVEVHVFNSVNSAEDYLKAYYNRYPTKVIQGVKVYEDVMYNSRIRGWVFEDKAIKIQDATSSTNDLFDAYLTKYS